MQTEYNANCGERSSDAGTPSPPIPRTLDRTLFLQGSFTDEHDGWNVPQ